ncbi:MAG: hypothetical protein GDA40_12245 [Rhodobacteraceae bacterium]|nr:hypothetical protein [Paracoccaceae bacterium]
MGDYYDKDRGGWFDLRVEDMPDDLRDAYLQVQMAPDAYQEYMMKQHFRWLLKDALCKGGYISADKEIWVSWKRADQISFAIAPDRDYRPPHTPFRF